MALLPTPAERRFDLLDIVLTPMTLLLQIMGLYLNIMMFLLVIMFFLVYVDSMTRAMIVTLKLSSNVIVLIQENWPTIVHDLKFVIEPWVVALTPAVNFTLAKLGW